MAQYILNMGGVGSSGFLDTVDVFRATANGVEAVTGHNLTLSSARNLLAAIACGSYIFAMGGRITGNYQSNAIDIFRVTDNGVETVTGHGLMLSVARENLVAASAGNYVLAMGGNEGNLGYSDAIDIFHITQNGVEAVTGHNLTLSSARRNLAAASVGNYILAMGGINSSGYSDAIDVFHITHNGVEAVTGHGLTLSTARENLVAASCGNYILAMGGSGSGGNLSNAIDIFRVTANGVEAVIGHGLTLSVARRNLAAASAGNYILAMGGGNYTTSYYDTVDIFRATDNGVEAVREYNLKLSTARRNLAAASAGNYILAMGGTDSDGYSNAIDVFEIIN